MASESEERPPTCHNYKKANQVPNHIRKYWFHRHDIFSKYDEGCWLTDDAWYGVTPEPVARKIAEHTSLAAPAHKTTIIDLFAGVGGNAIAFALSGRWDRVFAVERDPDALRCARHNAEIYGVARRIWWVEGDCFKMLGARFRGMGREAVVFASPPWGGPSYGADVVFDLHAMEPYNLKVLTSAIEKVTRDLVLYLPRTSDLNQLAQVAPEGRKMQAVHYCIHRFSKAICAYSGELEVPIQRRVEDVEDGIEESCTGLHTTSIRGSS